MDTLASFLAVLGGRSLPAPPRILGEASGRSERSGVKKVSTLNELNALGTA